MLASSSLRNSRALTFSAPRRLRTADIRKLPRLTPGIAVGYWKARKIPWRARSSVGQSWMFAPL